MSVGRVSRQACANSGTFAKPKGCNDNIEVTYGLTGYSWWWRNKPEQYVTSDAGAHGRPRVPYAEGPRAARKNPRNEPEHSSTGRQQWNFGRPRLFRRSPGWGQCGKRP